MFHLDDDYPGMLSAPTRLPAYADLSIYGARLVFGESYAFAEGGVVPEARTWLSLIPPGLGVLWAVRRRLVWGNRESRSLPKV